MVDIQKLVPAKEQLNRSIKEFYREIRLWLG